MGSDIPNKIASTSLTGTIPTELGSIQSLESLDVGTFFFLLLTQNIPMIYKDTFPTWFDREFPPGKTPFVFFWHRQQSSDG